MPEEQTGEEQPQQLNKYEVRLDGNRGSAVMKLTPEQAEEMGDRILEDLGPAKMYGMPESETKNVDQTAGTPEEGQQEANPAPPEEEQQEPAPATKRRTPANKSRTTGNE